MLTALAGGVAFLAVIWVAHVSGTAVDLAYLGPATLVFLLLGLGRYPGERLLARRARPSHKRSSTHAVAVACEAVMTMPRGGLLLAAALAGRAPPGKPGRV